MRILVAALALVIIAAAPANAGGSWLYPVEDRVEAGDDVTLVGYASVGQLGWVEDGPFYAYIRVVAPSPDDPVENAGGFPFIAETDVPIGELAVEEWGEPGFMVRAAITFQIPNELDPGTYSLVYCNDPCTEGLGDLIGADIYVGVDFGPDSCRPWSLDEPEIANLDPDALVCTNDGDLKASEVLAGAPYVNAGAEEPQPALTEAEALAVLGFDSRAELERMRQLAAQQSALSTVSLERLLGDRQLIVIDSTDRELSPYVLAAVVLGLMALAVVTIAAARLRAESR